MDKIIYAGIDVSSKTNVVALIDAEGKTVERIQSFPQNQSGAQRLEQWLKDLLGHIGPEKLILGTEATSFYDLHILDYLTESQLLKKFNPEIYRLNAKSVKKFRDSMGEKEKTDCQDAVVIALKLRSGSLPHPYFSFQPTLPLQRLTRYRIHLVNSITREKQHLLSHLFLKYSGYKTEGPLKEQIFGATSRAVLTDFFSSDDLVNQSVEELVAFVACHGKNRSRRSEEIAQGLKAMAKESYRIRPTLAKSVNIIMASSLCSIRALEKSLKEINQAIANEMKGFTNTLQSIPGIGPVYAAGIFAEIGDANRFSSSDQVAKMAGLWWPRNQSGDFEAEEKKLRRGGNRYLKCYLVEAANSVRRYDPEYQKYYQKKYQEVPYRKHKRALVLCARKLVRPVYALLKRGELYRGGKPQSFAN